MNSLVLTVSQLNQYTRSLLEQDTHLASVYVAGEISNFTNHYRSGHWYMSLKDSDALIGAVMFRSSAQKMRFMPQDGMKVICHGRVTLYDRDGRYQLYIDDMQPDGLGALNLAFEQRKEKLAGMGLFDPAHKKQLPAFPETIGVITSPTGAAVQDILNILSRRYPLAKVLFYPVQVQGDAAPAQLTEAVQRFSKYKDADVIILGRGGGSLEDLWAFNSEELAMAIYACPIPVISAVGHETDFTIADFVADLRAPTPSAAAELAVPEASALRSGLTQLKNRMDQQIAGQLQNQTEALERLSACTKLRMPSTLLEPYNQRFDQLAYRFDMAAANYMEKKQSSFNALAQRLQAYSPLGVLKRGYAIARRGNTVLLSSAQVKPGDRFNVTLWEGTLSCMVEKADGKQKEE